MQVQFGKKVFTKTKFDGLDGNTTVGFESEDGTFVSRATKAGVKFKLEQEIEDHGQLSAMVKTFGELMDATWKEHQLLKPKLAKTLSGH